MGIVSVTEQWSGRGGSINGKRERTYTRVFEVVTTDPYVGPVAVRLASGIPQIGATYENGVGSSDPRHEYDLGSFVSSIQAEAIGGLEGAGTGWTVTVGYSAFDWSEFAADPTLWKIRVTFGGERTERVCDFDRNGVPIRNSAYDKFGEPVTVDDHITTMTITRNEKVSTFDPNLASQYSDTINNATWNGIAARYAKMGLITTSDEQYDSNGHIWYYKVTYPVQVNRRPWRKELLDQGYNELTAYSSGGGTGVRPIMFQGQPVSDPQALNGAGNVLPKNAVPVTLTFDVFDEADWSGLNIDLSTRLGL